MKTTQTDIVIIGGGLSGCLVSMQLLQHHPKVRLCMIEKKPEQLARGIAYARHFTGQLLNVPVMGMSIDPDQPNHFYNWLQTHADQYPGLVWDAHAFVPRSIYGDYVEEHFKAATQAADERFRLVFDEALGAEKKENTWEIICKHAGTIEAKYLVLSTGNLPPADISVKTNSFLRSPLYVSNPWTPGLIRDLDPHRNVLLIGSGLTAIDIVLALYDQRHIGQIYLLSRRGKMPLPHAPVRPYQLSDPQALLSGKIHATADALRKEIKKAKREGFQWQQVMDALRPWTQQAWMKMDLDQRAIFLNRLRSYWEIHRHRVPVSSLEKINEMKSKGQLVHYTGQLIDVKEMGDGRAETFYRNKKEQSVITDLVINCTGPENNFRKYSMPLLVDLMKKGLVTSDALNLGIACDEKGKVINQHQQADSSCYCMGHLRKGTFWETTAVRELREQAREIAEEIYK